MPEPYQRVLILSGKARRDLLSRTLGQHFKVEFAECFQDALEALRVGSYHGVFADVEEFLPIEQALVADQSTLVLNTIGEGVCIVDSTSRCVWSNNQMRRFRPEVFEQVKRVCIQAIKLFSVAGQGQASSPVLLRRKFTFQEQDRYFEVTCSPVTTGDSDEPQVVAVVWDATSGRQLQSKLDAIDASGRELCRIDSDAVAKLTPSQRLDLLQDKIIKYSKDLMQFDHFAVLLLEKRSNKLELVIAEGLPQQSLQVDLYAQPDGNGISGYVAATGRSYICHDTEKDPRYVAGLDHCRSSLTVPLRLYDEVVGVYNVESKSVGSFNEDDRQFAEIFVRHVALALNILDLLVVERCTTSGQITESVVQEMAQPLNDIVTESQSLIEEYIGDDLMRERLNRILEQVEMIRHAIRDVAAGPKTILGSLDDEVQTDKAWLSGKTVLVADDEENIRRTIREVLRKHGCIVQSCQDGYEACTFLEQQRFDLVISDIKMPHRSGYEVFAAAQQSGHGTPVVLMTGFGYDPHHSIVRASQEGLASVLFKPFRVDQLLEEVGKVLSDECKPDDSGQRSGEAQCGEQEAGSGEHGQAP